VSCALKSTEKSKLSCFDELALNLICQGLDRGNMRVERFDLSENSEISNSKLMSLAKDKGDHNGWEIR
jgi:hypothetical protein